MQGRTRLVIGVLAMLAVAGALVYSLRWWQARQPENLLRLQGHMEATETDLSFKVSGLIEQIFFQEGDWVTSGQKAAVLEAKDLKDQVAKARADLAAAKANLAKMETGYRPQEVKEAQAQAGKTEADLANKQLDYERYENLYRRQVVAAQTRDKAKSDYLMAQEEHQSALAELNLRREGYRAEDIDQAREQAKAAQASLDLALTGLGYATIYSPVNGVVLVRPMEPGMTAAVGAPVLTLGDLDNIYLDIYPRVRYGPGQVRHEGLHHHRRLPRQAVSRLGFLHQLQGRVHPQDGGDLQGAGNPGVPHQDPGPEPQLRPEAGHAGGSGNPP